MCQGTTAQSEPERLSTETLDVTVQRTEFTGGGNQDEFQFIGNADSKVLVPTYYGRQQATFILLSVNTHSRTCILDLGSDLQERVQSTTVPLTHYRTTAFSRVF